MSLANLLKTGGKAITTGAKTAGKGVKRAGVGGFNLIKRNPGKTVAAGLAAGIIVPKVAQNIKEGDSLDEALVDATFDVVDNTRGRAKETVDGTLDDIGNSISKIISSFWPIILLAVIVLIILSILKIYVF